MFKQCQPPQSEVELYQIVNAPAQLTRTIPGRRAQPARGNRPAVPAVEPRQITYPNARGVVMHAHRRDHPALDAPPNLGCSSKLGAGSLIAHNRNALADTRPWGAAQPQIVYGAIYQWWQRDPTAHPTFPNNKGIEYPAAGHYPDDRIFSAGYGTYPPGHPGNTIGLPGAAANTKSAPAGNNVVSKSAPTATNGSKPKPWVFVAASGKSYPTIPLIAPYAKLPPPSAAAVKSAQAAVVAIQKANAPLVVAFTKAWAAFMAAWDHISNSPYGDDASVMANIPEFTALYKLANARTAKDLIALVVFKLATEPKSFVGIYLYNALEKNTDFLVYKKDLFNYNVLQRHAQLIVEMNNGRK